MALGMGRCSLGRGSLCECRGGELNQLLINFVRRGPMPFKADIRPRSEAAAELIRSAALTV